MVSSISRCSSPGTATCFHRNVFSKLSAADKEWPRWLSTGAILITIRISRPGSIAYLWSVLTSGEALAQCRDADLRAVAVGTRHRGAGWLIVVIRETAVIPQRDLPEHSQLHELWMRVWLLGQCRYPSPRTPGSAPRVRHSRIRAVQCGELSHRLTDVRNPNTPDVKQFTICSSPILPSHPILHPHGRVSWQYLTTNLPATGRNCWQHPPFRTGAQRNRLPPWSPQARTSPES
jgi:hypothetical protein